MEERHTTSTERLAGEELRLRRAFLPILLFAAGSPVAIACGADHVLEGPEQASAAGVSRNEGDVVRVDGGIDLDAAPCAPEPTLPTEADASDDCVEFKR